MKKFEQLTNAEKQKLSVYLQYVNFIQITTIITLFVGLGIFLVGYSLLLIFVVPVIMIVGTVLLFVGMVFALFTIISMMKDKKYLFLIFGYKNLYSDIFDINQEDIKKVKIIRKIEWIKEK